MLATARRGSVDLESRLVESQSPSPHQERDRFHAINVASGVERTTVLLDAGDNPGVSQFFKLSLCDAGLAARTFCGNEMHVCLSKFIVDEDRRTLATQFCSKLSQ